MINLKEKRKEKGVTQEQLAEQCGLFRTAISNIECGANMPSVKVAKKIAEILDFDWTLFYDDED